MAEKTVGRKGRDLKAELSVDVRTNNKRLRDIPAEKLKLVLMTMLSQPQQEVRKPFILLVDGQQQSGNHSQSDWLDVTKIIRDSPDVGIGMRIGFSGNDIVWGCRLVIPPAYVCSKDHPKFLQSMKTIAKNLFDKNRKVEGNELPTKHESETGVVQSEILDVENFFAQTDETVDEAVGQVLTEADQVTSGPVESVEQISDEKAKKKIFKKVFEQCVINNFLKNFVEKAGNEFSPLDPDQILEIFQKMNLKCNHKGAMHHLVISEVIDRQKSRQRGGPEFVWLSPKAKQYYAFLLQREKGDDPLAVIEELRRERAKDKALIEMMQNQLKEIQELLILASSNIERRNEALDFLREKNNISAKKRKEIDSILVECVVQDDVVLERTRKMGIVTD